MHLVHLDSNKAYVFVVFLSVGTMVSDHSAICKSDTGIYSTSCSTKDSPAKFFIKLVSISSTHAPLTASAAEYWVGSNVLVK